MKKLITSLLVVVLALSCCALIFASCEFMDYDHTIVFYSTQNDDLQALTDVAIARFEEKFPGYKVEHQQPGGYDEVRSKIVSDLQGQEQPDIAYCYPDHVALYLESGKVVDLQELMDSTKKVTNENGEEYVIGMTQAEKDDFIEVYLEEGRADKFSSYKDYGYTAQSLFALPFAKSTELMFYNEDALKACNLEPAKTWDELWQQAPILKKAYPLATILGYDSESNWFITESERQGWGYTSTDVNKHYLFSNERAAAWLDQIQEYAKQGYITTQKIYNSYTSNLFKKGVIDKATQKPAAGAIYCIGSSGGAKNQATTAFKVGVTSVPGSVVKDASGNIVKDSDGNAVVSNKVISQGPSLVMLKSDKASDPSQKTIMTWMFMKELYEVNYQVSIAKLQGYNPAIKSAIASKDYQKFIADETSITGKAAKVATDIMDNYFTSVAFVGSSTARDQVGNVMVYVIKREKDGAKALRDALKNCGG